MTLLIASLHNETVLSSSASLYPKNPNYHSTVENHRPYRTKTPFSQRLAVNPLWNHSTLPGQVRRLAGIQFGPIDAIDEKVDELHEKANDHWIRVWKVNNCDKKGGKFDCNDKSGIPQRVLQFWIDNREQAPGTFGAIASAVHTAESDTIDESDTVVEERSADWTFATEGAVSSVPSAYRGGQNGQMNTVVTSHDKRIYGLNEKGDKVWSKKLKAPIEGSPTVNASGNILVGDLSGKIYSIDGEGKLIWSKQLDGKILGSTAIFEGTMIIGTTNGKVYLLDQSSGEINKIINTEGKVTASAAIDVQRNQAYIGSWDGKVYSINLSTHEIDWTFSTEGKIKSSPAIGQNIYVGNNNNTVYAITKSGDTAWKHKANGAISSSPVISRDKTIYVGSWDHNIYALNADNGDTKWTFTTGGRVVSSPLVLHKQLLIGSGDGQLYAIDKDGVGLWKIDTNDPISSSPTLNFWNDNPQILVGSNDGKIYGINLPREVIFRSRWFSYQSDQFNTGKQRPLSIASHWYVNDENTQNDVYTTSTGSDTVGKGRPDKPFRTLDKTMDFVQPGDRIFVDAGTYGETVSLNYDNLSLIGADSSTTGTVLDFEDSSAAMVAGITVSGVSQAKIRNLRVRSAYNGLGLVDSPRTTIRNATFESNGSHGIRLSSSNGPGSDSATITNVVVKNNKESGIEAIASDSFTLKNSLAKKNDLHGIHISSSSGGIFENNHIIKNGAQGLQLTSSSNDNTLRNNIAKNNADNGFMLSSSDNNLLVENTADTNQRNGFILNGSSNNILKSNESINNKLEGYDLVLSSNNNKQVSNTAISNGRDGLSLNNADHNTLRSNLSRENDGNGLFVKDANNNKIHQNEIVSEKNPAIAITGTSSSDTITRNIINTPDQFVSLSNSSGNSFDVTRNWWGITGSVEDEISDTDTINNIDFSPFRLSTIDTSVDADTIAPKTPKMNFPIPDSSTVVINWDQVTTNQDGKNLGDFKEYRVYLGSSDSFIRLKRENARKRLSPPRLPAEITIEKSYFSIANIKNVSDTQFRDGRLRIGDTYFYRVTAVDDPNVDGGDGTADVENELPVSDSVVVTREYGENESFVSDSVAVNREYKEHNVLHSLDITGSDTKFLQTPYLFPDGSKVAYYGLFSGEVPCMREVTPNLYCGDIYLNDRSGGNETRLTDAPFQADPLNQLSWGNLDYDDDATAEEVVVFSNVDWRIDASPSHGKPYYIHRAQPYAVPTDGSATSISRSQLGKYSLSPGDTSTNYHYLDYNDGTDQIVTSKSGNLIVYKGNCAAKHTPKEYKNNCSQPKEIVSILKYQGDYSWFVTEPRWSRDGSKLAFVRYDIRDFIPPKERMSTEIWVLRNAQDYIGNPVTSSSNSDLVRIDGDISNDGPAVITPSWGRFNDILFYSKDVSHEFDINTLRDKGPAIAYKQGQFDHFVKDIRPGKLFRTSADTIASNDFTEWHFYPNMNNGRYSVGTELETSGATNEVRLKVYRSKINILDN